MFVTRYPFFVAALRRYFYSGWAFLIPYLAAYLLYYVTKWPVNPDTAGVRIQSIGMGSVAHIIPCLLHVYWALHATHLVLAALALRSWLRANVTEPESSLTAYACHLHLLRRLAPWLLLALIFYIPGVYLEWPSDPWEHLRRINEWHIVDAVGTHSTWHKASYFISYSFLNELVGRHQLFWLDFYYTGICLLLCWQYYRLARACNLGARASMVFVILQALLFGNNVFSFYRYYGISSTIYAQLGAIALIRMVLEWASHGTVIAAPFGLSTPAIGSPRSIFWSFPRAVWLMANGSCLLVLIAFNHVQGIGIAALGITAIIAWRLIEWSRSLLWWLIGCAIAANILSLWIHPHPPSIEAYHTQGWFSALRGLHTLDSLSPAAAKTLQILSLIGIANMVVGLVLVFRRCVIGWLTLVPILFLSSSWVVWLIAATRKYYETDVTTIHRVLLGVPCALALCSLAKTIQSRPIAPGLQKSRDLLLEALVKPRFYVTIVVALAILQLLDPKHPFYARTWHSLMNTPRDGSMDDLVDSLEEVPARLTTTRSIATAPLNMVQLSQLPQTSWSYYGRAGTLPAAELSGIVSTPLPYPVIMPIADRFEPTRPYSIAGASSAHWSPQEIPLVYAGTPELENFASRNGFQPIRWSTDKDRANIYFHR